MPKRENKMIRRRVANAYLSSVISISLVLLLIGLAALIAVNTRSVSNYLKENMMISVLLQDNVTDEQAESYVASINTLPYVHSSQLITRAEGTEDLKKMLGSDFLSVFETSPVPISVDVTLKAAYVEPDSLTFVTKALGASPLVDEVNCQESLVDTLSENLGKISLILGVFILLLLFISFVLINNMVRLNLYARRFTIHTMQLVGATRSFITAPFLRGATLQGLIASLLATGTLWALLSAVRKSFPELYSIFDIKMLLLVSGIIVVCGVLICVLSTWLVVYKLVGSSNDDLYY